MDHLGKNRLQIYADSQKHVLHVSGYDPVTRDIQAISCINALYPVIHRSSVD